MRWKVSMGLVLSLVVLSYGVDGQDTKDEFSETEWTPYDGWYNNLAHPEWGSVDSPLSRRCPPAYQDGVYQPSGWDRPNPRLIARECLGGPTGHHSHSGKSALLVFFGQQVVEEILDAQRPANPPEYFNIEIPKGDPLYDPEGTGGKVIPLLRTRYSTDTGTNPGVPRMQLNEITPWIDGGLHYGTARAWSDALRAFDPSRPGRLKCYQEPNGTENCQFPGQNTIGLPLANPPPPLNHTFKPVSRFWMLGNPRGNENPALLSMGIMWFRFHNFHADRIHKKFPTWSDERVYQVTRQYVIAVHQHVVMYNWLPTFLGKNPSNYSGYNPSTFPGIVHEFQTAAMRFGHTMIVPGMYRRDPKSCQFQSTTERSGGSQTGKLAVRTCNSYWNPQLPHLESGSAAHMIFGLASQGAEREDTIITPDLHGFVFGPLDASRRDLMAINIQRARDHGVGSYNDVRECYGLPKRTSFDEVSNYTKDQRFNFQDPVSNETINSIDRTISKMKELYNGNLSLADLWPAGLAEVGPTGPGELFSTIILNQFERIRDGDRFWYENTRGPLAALIRSQAFGGIDEIKKYNIRKVILEAFFDGDDEGVMLQDDPFNISKSPCREPEALKADLNTESCTPPKTYDYFRGHTPTNGSFTNVNYFERVDLVRMSCPFSKESARLLRDEILSSMRHIDLQGSNTLGETNFDSRTQIILVVAAVFIYMVLTLVVMWIFTKWKLSSKNMPSGKTREVPTLDQPSGDDGRTRYGVVLLDRKPVLRLTKNMGEAGILTLRGESLVLAQVSGRFSIRHEISRICELQYWMNFVCLVVEPYAFDPNVKVASYLKFEDSGASRLDFQNALMRIQPFGIVVTEKPSIVSLGSPNLRTVNFDIRRREVESVFAGAAIQALTISEKQANQSPSDKELQHLGFDLTHSFLHRAHNIAGGFSLKSSKVEDAPLNTDRRRPSDNAGAEFRRFASDCPLDEEAPDVPSVTRGLLSSNAEKFSRIRSARQSQVSTVIHDSALQDSLVRILSNTNDPVQGSRRSAGIRSVNSLRSSQRPSNVAARARLPGFQEFTFNEETRKTFSTRPEISLDEFAAHFKLPSDSFIVQRLFRTFTSAPDRGVLSLEELAGGLSALLGREVEQASVIAGVLGGGSAILKESEVKQIVVELVGASGHSTAEYVPQVMAIVDAIFSGVASMGPEGARTIQKEELERAIISNAALLRGKALDDRLCWDLVDPNTESGWENTNWFIRARSFHHEHRKELFWVTLFFVATGLIFGERFYTYNVDKEVGGLRRILGYGVSVTRGSASVQMFAYSVILLPMCRNLITILERTILNKFIPFDRAYDFHVLAGITGGVFTVVHVTGHFFNFYNIATQTASDLAGIFRDVWWSSDFLPTFAWWLFGTVTGMTGILLTFVSISLFVFTLKRVRDASYSFFLGMHHITVILLYVLTFLHGSFALIQKPLFQFFLSVPLALYILDKVIGAAQSSRLLRIEDAKILPSGTVALYVEKPMNLIYRSGQCARLQLVQLGRKEFHPFTISSAPHEKFVSFHIQPVGPWTNRLRDMVAGVRKTLPRCRMDGPYGEGFSSWSSYEVVVLIGSGLGVTPFMSMLKETAYRSSSNSLNIRTRKIYCVLILRHLTDFEWLVELIREVEKVISAEMLEMIFYTTSTRVNDFRSLFLRYFEETSQLFAARSALTNTRGFCLFGRPDFDSLLAQVNRKVIADSPSGALNPVGVFTCGSPAVESVVKTAIRRHNDHFNADPSSFCYLKQQHLTFAY